MRFPVLFSLVTLAACSGASTGDIAGSQADTKHSGDHGAPSHNYPAFPTGLPQLTTSGGAVLANPRVVTVTWTADPLSSTFDRFGGAIGGSDYWRTSVSEYGVGPATAGPPVHITSAPPKSMTDESLEKMIADNVENAPASGWPEWTSETIYLVYVPEGVHVTTKSSGANACDDSLGYHSEVNAGGNRVVYAIVNENCRDKKSGEEILPFSTRVASHEIGEAATDPFVNTDVAWGWFDDDHQGYTLFQAKQSENGDACEFFDDSMFETSESGFDFNVQRMWSNASAAAGHNPCVPLDGRTYFNVTPLDLETVSILMPNKQHKDTKGVGVPVGSTKTIALGFASDAPLDGWTIKAVEGDPMAPPSKTHLDLSLDRTSGQNGEKASLTITTRSKGAQRGNFVTVVSTKDGTSHYMPILVQTTN